MGSANPSLDRRIISLTPHVGALEVTFDGPVLWDGNDPVNVQIGSSTSGNSWPVLNGYIEPGNKVWCFPTEEPLETYDSIAVTGPWQGVTGVQVAWPQTVGPFP